MPWLRSTWHATTVFVGKCVMRTAVSTLFTFCPPLPPARYVSTRSSSGRMLISMRSSISGITKTDANEVCRRAAWSNGEMRTSRCTPVSPASSPYAFSPENWTVAFLIPASSPGDSSSTTAFIPFRSAQRRYMRSRIEAQSCDSVPPAPGLMVMMALRWSVSPESSVRVSCSDDVVSALVSSRSRSFSSSCALVGVGLFGGQRNVRVDVARNAVSFSSALIWSSERLRSRSTACARVLVAPEIGRRRQRASSAFSFSRCCAASKKTPNEGDARLQSFVAILEVFENHWWRRGASFFGDSSLAFSQ